MKNLFTLLFLSLMGFSSLAQSCLLDPSFGNGGKATGYFATNSNPRASNIILLQDGKFIQAGEIFSTATLYDFALIKYTKEGRVDSTFGTNGIVSTSFGSNTDDYMGAVVRQTDGRLVVAGTSYNQGNADFALARFNSNGSLDSSFGNNGKVVTALSADHDYAQYLTLQPDGKIIVAGSSSRMDSFSCSYDEYYVPITAIVRYQQDGKLDSSFGQNGRIFLQAGQGFDYARAVSFQSGKILVAGTGFYNCGCGYYGGVDCYSSYLRLIRLNDNGSLDNSFGQNGKVTDSVVLLYPTDMITQPDGKILITGSGSEAGFISERFNNNGSLDQSFGNAGKVITMIDQTGYAWPTAITLQEEKIIIVGGYYPNNGDGGDFAIVRYNSNGSLDSTLNNSGTARIHFGSSWSSDEASAVAVQDNKIIVGGFSNNYYEGLGSIGVIRLLDSGNRIPIVITAGSPLSFCEGGFVSLTSSVAGNLQWFKNGLAIAGATNPVYTASTSGYYTVSIVNSTSCGVSPQVEVIVNSYPPKPKIQTAGGVTNFCAGGKVNLFTYDLGDLQWYRNGNAIVGATTGTYSADSLGIYSLRVKNFAGCQSVSDPVVITSNMTIPKPPISWDGVYIRTSDSYARYEWYYNNVLIFGDSLPTHKPVIAGSYRVKVTDFGNCSNVSDSFLLVVTDVTDIVIGDSKLRYYPNPAQSEFFVDITNMLRGKLEAELYDITGKFIKKQALNQTHNRISVHQLPVGLYQLIIQNGQDKVSVKLMLVK